MASITNTNIHTSVALALPADPSDAAVETSRALYDKAMAHMAEADRWRLFIDFPKQDQGGDSFDIEEPGYRQGMENGLKYIRDNLGVQFNAAKLSVLHDICIDGVFQNPEKTRPFRKGYHYGRGYPFRDKAITPAGKKDLVSKNLICRDLADVNPDFPAPLTYAIKWPPNPEIHLINFFTYACLFPKGLLTAPAEADINKINATLIELNWEEGIKLEIDGMFEVYYKSMAAAQTDDEKLALIVDLCRSLEMWHGFEDANQRTIAFALFPKLLIENNFSPAIIEIPVMFDGYFSTEEMVQMAKEGMERFQKFAH